MLKTFIIPILKNYVPNTIRHAATAGAGYLVTSGVLGASEGEQAAGIILGALTLIWSVVEKKGLLNKLFA